MRCGAHAHGRSAPAVGTAARRRRSGGGSYCFVVLVRWTKRPSTRTMRVTTTLKPSSSIGRRSPVRAVTRRPPLLPSRWIVTDVASVRARTTTGAPVSLVQRTSVAGKLRVASRAGGPVDGEAVGLMSVELQAGEERGVVHRGGDLGDAAADRVDRLAVGLRAGPRQQHLPARSPHRSGVGWPSTPDSPLHAGPSAGSSTLLLGGLHERLRRRARVLRRGAGRLAAWSRLLIGRRWSGRCSAASRGTC